MNKTTTIEKPSATAEKIAHAPRILEVSVDPKCTIVVPPNAIRLISGVVYAKIFAKDHVQLTYENGETESAVVGKAAIAAATDNFFSLVSSVQDHRPNTLQS